MRMTRSCRGRSSVEYAALNAVVAIPARTAPGQQAKLRAAYVALEDALHDDPMCGHREEWAALRVLGELVDTSPTLPAEDPEPDAAPAADAQPARLTEDAELEDYAIFDLESAFFDMRAEIAIIGHIATSERVVGPEVWRRIEDHLELALDTLETSWKVAYEHRHVLSNALKAERAAYKALERARIEDAQPGSPADIEDAEGLWTFMQNISRMVLKRHNDAAPAA